MLLNQNGSFWTPKKGDEEVTELPRTVFVRVDVPYPLMVGTSFLQMDGASKELKGIGRRKEAPETRF